VSTTVYSIYSLLPSILRSQPEDAPCCGGGEKFLHNKKENIIEKEKQFINTKCWMNTEERFVVAGFISKSFQLQAQVTLMRLG
jgi:hypothetical protein